MVTPRQAKRLERAEAEAKIRADRAELNRLRELNMTPADRAARLLKTLDAKIEFSTHWGRTVEDFKKRLESDPCYAFEWGNDAAKAAARIWATKWMTGTLANIRENLPEATDEEVVLKLGRCLHEMVLHGALYPKHSTSPISNFVETEKTSALAEYLEYFRIEVTAK